MPYDIQQLTITPAGNVSPTIQQLIISGLIVDSGPGHAVLFDHTGANTILWPNVLTNLNAAQRLELLQLVLNYLIHALHGL